VEPENGQIYEFENFRLDSAKRVLSGADGNAEALMPKAFDLLAYLVANPGRLIEKDELMSAIWPDTVVEENNLTQNISALRRVLGERHRENRFIATVPGRGYKFVAPVTTLNGSRSVDQNGTLESDALPPEEDAEVVDTGTPGTRVHLIPMLVATFVLLALAVGAFFLLKRPGTVGVDGEIKSLAVLPFKPLASDSRDDAMELGMTDTLITKLSGGEILVRPITAVRRFGSLDQDPVAAGRALGVEAVLDGTIQIADDRVRVSALLIRVSDGKQLWADQFNQKAVDIFELQNSISERVASALRTTLGSKPRKDYTDSLEAYQLYAKGKLHISRLVLPEVQKGIASFEHAIAVDPGYAPVYVELANAYRAMALTNDARPDDVMPKAKAAARKAVEIDDGLAEAHTALALVAFWYDFDPSEADRHHRRALELDPRSSLSRFAYAHFLSNTGRHDEALVEIRRARELDPVSLVTNAQEGQILFFAGKDDEALRVLQATAEMDSSFWLTPLFLSRIHIRHGDWDAAIAAATKARDLSHGNSEAVATIGFAQAGAGKTADARAIVHELEERAKVRYVAPYTLAQLYTALGETEKALDLLEISLKNRDSLMTFLKVDPKWDSLRSEPRFGELLRKMHLE
jgi:DNA-binding winged helix-turn-helix (wHTH) protein/TolB-like protein/Flp pilus assembly protein TadD